MISLGISKEIRMVSREWALAMALATSPLWWLILALISGSESSNPANNLPAYGVLLGIGCAWLATTLIGKENRLGTLEQLVAQPISRRRLWARKAGVTALVLVTTIIAFLVSCLLALSIIPNASPNDYHQIVYQIAWVVFLCTLGPGLLFAGWLQSFHEAFWFTLLVPIALLLTLSWLPQDTSASTQAWVLWITLSTYGFTTLCLAYWVWLRWQGIGQNWQSIDLNLPTFRATSRPDRHGDNLRPHPLRTLIGKELRIHQFSFAVTIFFALIYFAYVYVVMNDSHRWETSMVRELRGLFRMCWLLIPACIGAAAIAEERSLGVTDWQSTLPASRLSQWFTKLAVVLGLAFLLGAIVPAPLDAWFQAQSEASTTVVGQANNDHITLQLLAWGSPLLVALLAFFASSLATSLLQALLMTAGLMIILAIQLTLTCGILRSPTPHDSTYLVCLVTALVLGPCLLITAYRHFCNWEGLAKGLKTVVSVWITGSLLSLAISYGALSRFWDAWKPTPAIVHRAADHKVPSRIYNDHNGMAILAPNGKLWSLSLETNDTTTPSLRPMGPEGVWQSVAVSGRNRYGLRPDGQLWIWSRSADFPHLYQDPIESHHKIESDLPWRDVQVVNRSESNRLNTYIYALKQDGSLHTLAEEVNELPQAFTRIETEEPLQAFAATPHYLLGILESGELVLIGNDPKQLVRRLPTGDVPASRPGALHRVSPDTDWSAILIQDNAVWLPRGGLMLQPHGNLYLFPMETRHRFPAPWFQKKDGTYWTFAWTASLIMGQANPLATPHRLVEIDKSPWKKSVGMRDFPQHSESYYALNAEGSVSWIQIPTGPFPPGIAPQKPKVQRINDRSDWQALHRVYNSETILGITANGILWSWGSPLNEMHFPSLHEYRPFHILPYSWLPSPVFDLLNASPLSP